MIAFLGCNKRLLTADKQNMTVDCYVLWSVSDPLKFYQSLGNTSVAEERLNALTYNALTLGSPASATPGP